MKKPDLKSYPFRRADMREVPVYNLALPQYKPDIEPNDKELGRLLDDEIKKHFLGQDILVRGVASSEHSDMATDELVGIIRQTGTDRYDIERKGDRYENIGSKHIDLFAFPINYSADTEMMHMLFWGFYHSAKGIHGYPMRIDIVTIYDATQMEQILHQYEGRDDIKDDGFVFKNPNDKLSALKAIIKLS